MKRRIILLCCNLVMMWHGLIAQSISNLEPVMTEMKDLQAFYNNHPLSFSVKYTYANEHDPGRVLDSLSGKIEMAGVNYRCWMDSTETIRNDRYNIVLFKEDKIMYLTKPAGVVAADPVQLIQATLEKTGVSSAEIQRQGNLKTVRLFFGAGKPYRQMEMTIDTLSGHLIEMYYIVKTALLMETPEGKEVAAQGYDEYALVRASFEQYLPLPVNPARFDEHVFFSKKGNEFNTTQAYKDYKLIVGSPNL